MDSLKITYKMARRIVIGLVGSTVLLIGIVMIVTPGPAFIVIPLGLAILGLEFAWARLWMRRLRHRLSAHNQKNHGERVEKHRQRHTDTQGR
jgi:tellurite resistance protein TerC